MSGRHGIAAQNFSLARLLPRQRLDYPRPNLRPRVKIASCKGAILNFAETPKLTRFKISAARNFTQKHHVLTECRSVLKFKRANFKFSKFRKFQNRFKFDRFQTDEISSLLAETLCP